MCTCAPLRLVSAAVLTQRQRRITQTQFAHFVHFGSFLRLISALFLRSTISAQQCLLSFLLFFLRFFLFRDNDKNPALLIRTLLELKASI